MLWFAPTMSEREPESRAMKILARLIYRYLGIEMESGGEYRAAYAPFPMLAIRGISDIVGPKRAEAWIKYAWASAAAFTRAFLCTGPIALGAAVHHEAESSHVANKIAPAQATHDRSVSSLPAEERRITSNELLLRLLKLLPGQFDVVVSLARIPPVYLSGTTAAQATRATEVMRYIEEQNRLEQFSRIIDLVATEAGPIGVDPR